MSPLDHEVRTPISQKELTTLVDVDGNITVLSHDFPRLCTADFERGGKEWYDSLGVPVTREMFISKYEDKWPRAQAVTLQHMAGGLLALPAVLNLFDHPKLQSGLACLSVLSELGWEVEDQLGWLYVRYFTEGGKTKAPMGLIKMLALHHSLGTQFLMSRRRL